MNKLLKPRTGELVIVDTIVWKLLSPLENDPLTWRAQVVFVLTSDDRHRLGTTEIVYAGIDTSLCVFGPVELGQLWSDLKTFLDECCVHWQVKPSSDP